MLTFTFFDRIRPMWYQQIPAHGYAKEEKPECATDGGVRLANRWLNVKWLRLPTRISWANCKQALTYLSKVLLKSGKINLRNLADHFEGMLQRPKTNLWRIRGNHARALKGENTLLNKIVCRCLTTKNWYNFTIWKERPSSSRAKAPVCKDHWRLLSRVTLKLCTRLTLYIRFLLKYMSWDRGVEGQGWIYTP